MENVLTVFAFPKKSRISAFTFPISLAVIIDMIIIYISLLFVFDFVLGVFRDKFF